MHLFNTSVYRAILGISCSRSSVLLGSAWAADGLASPWQPSVGLLLCFLKNPSWALSPEYIQEGQTKIKLEQFQSAIEPQLEISTKSQITTHVFWRTESIQMWQKKTKPFCCLRSWCEKLFELDRLWVTIWSIFLVLIICSLVLLIFYIYR